MTDAATRGESAARGARDRGLRLLAFSVILLLAALLRVPSHNWDQNTSQNPDEFGNTQVTVDRVQLPDTGLWSILADPAHNPLNPRAGGVPYAYGSLPIYLTKATSAGIAWFTGDPYFASFIGVEQTGRVLAALGDTLTVLLVGATGVRLWGWGPGASAAALYAWAILPIQIAHFYIVEPFLTLFLTAGLFSSVLCAQTGRGRFAVGAGLCLGLALACKLSAAPFLVVPLGAMAGWAWAHQAGWRRALGGVTLVVGGTALGLLAGDPFAVLDAPVYLAQVSEQVAVQSGALDRWWTRRYVGTWPVLYPWGQLMLLGAGPLVGVAGTLGLLSAGWRGEMGRGAARLVVLGALVYFLSIAFIEAKWVRYLLPLVPYLCLGAAAAGCLAWRTAGQGRLRVLIGALQATVLLSAALGALAYSAIYGADHTHMQTLRWIYSHVPAGSRIGVEANDGPLLLPLPAYPNAEQAYTPVSIRMLADQSSPQVVAMLRDRLAESDYLVVSNTRAPRIVPRMPWRYPVQTRYYDLLFAGQLGFTPVYTVTSYPELLGLRIPDAGSLIDASFFENDHPAFYIFHKDRLIDLAEWTRLFAPVAGQAAPPSRHAP